MASPDPPPNSLGLDIVQPEPASADAQSTLAKPPSSSPQPTTQPLADATDSIATDTAASPKTTAAGTDNVDKDDDATKGSNVSKKTPYINPERVNTGGMPRDKLTDEELAERMARMREQNEKIKQRRLDVAADEDAFKQTQAAERQRQAKMRKVQETVNRTREQNARKKLGGIQSREWDSDKKAEGWSTTEKLEAPVSTTTRTNTGDRSEEPEASSAPASPTVKPRGDKRGRGQRGRGRGRGNGRGRGEKAPTNNIGDPPPEPENDGKAGEGK